VRRKRAHDHDDEAVFIRLRSADGRPRSRASITALDVVLHRVEEMFALYRAESVGEAGTRELLKQCFREYEAVIADEVRRCRDEDTRALLTWAARADSRGARGESIAVSSAQGAEAPR
jgi:hypothetical protein